MVQAFWHDEWPKTSSGEEAPLSIHVMVPEVHIYADGSCALTMGGMHCAEASGL